MALEEDLAESSTSSPASSTNHVFQAAPPGTSENLRCPICLDTINDRASTGWRRHPFCFSCLVEWFHRRAMCPVCHWPFPHTFCMGGDSNNEVYSIGQHSSSSSHAQEGRAGPSSEERRWHHSSGRQHCNSYSGTHGSSCSGTQERRRSRYPRWNHHDHDRVQQAQGYYPSRGRRRQQSRARSTARDNSRALRTKQYIRVSSRRSNHRQRGPRVSFIEPQVTRSRSRQRSRSTVRQTLRENLRRMERDEGRTLRHEWYMHAASGRNECRHQGRQLSYRESQMTRNRSWERSHSTCRQTLQENPRRMEYDEGHVLRTEQNASTFSGRSQRHQQGHQVSFTEPRVTRSQTRGMSHSTRRQTLQENLRRMECDEGQALRLEQGAPTSLEWSERHQRRQQVPFSEP